MPRLLYISPYFPPQTRVGALRPLKFVRHLGDFGWDVTVLCDLKRGAAVDPDLLQHVPENVEVVADYARGAAERFAALQGAPPPPPKSPAAPRPPGRLKRFARTLETRLWSPEYVPLGEHSLDIPWARSAATRLLERGGYDAMLVNADPYAAMLVGDTMGERFGVPVVHDLRDPWATCDLRRPRRPAPQRALIDRLERRCVAGSHAFVLNTATALDVARAHYADDPALVDRLRFVRNHGDPALVDHGAWDTPNRFTLLFLGTFRRFVQGEALLRALALLAERGRTPRDLALRITGTISPEAQDTIRALGVTDFVETHPFVPYPEVGPFMRTADLLIAVTHASTMRIPAKFYDYATSDRPLLMIGDPRHTELAGLVADLPGATWADLTDPLAIADAIESAMGAGRQQHVERSAAGLDSRTATARLVELLPRV